MKRGKKADVSLKDLPLRSRGRDAKRYPRQDTLCEVFPVDPIPVGSIAVKRNYDEHSGVSLRHVLKAGGAATW